MCTDLVADFECTCSPGFSGDLCETGKKNSEFSLDFLLTIIILTVY